MTVVYGRNGAGIEEDGPSGSTFADKYRNAVRANESVLCVGLDPDRDEMPDGIRKADFLLAIVEATRDLVCAYKPNSPFFEEDGAEGFNELKHVIDGIAQAAPGVPVILDSKRADIGNTSRFFARSVFGHFGADATVVNPYMGFDGLKPFVEYDRKHTFVLCRTSNPGARHFQDLKIAGTAGTERPLYQEVAAQTQGWGKKNVGLVVAATYPDEAREVRALCPDMLFLVPGVGAQQGEIQRTVDAVSAAAPRSSAEAGVAGGRIIVNASRSILYAGKDEPDYRQRFAMYARGQAEALRGQLNAAREQVEREAAVHRFTEERKRQPLTGMTRDELLAARHEGHRV